MSLNVLYFAWLRERIGEPSETVETSAETVAGLVEELKSRGPHYELAFSDLASIRVAVDQELSEYSTPLSGAREIAFFPPMTGG